MSRSFTSAWLTDAAAALEFLPPSDPPHRRAAVEKARQRQVHPAVLETLEAHTPAQQANRDALADGAVCVVTGQQAGLFGGPLYTLYKTAAAIVDARALSTETGHPCVPVFWLQNEDHDFEEIASCSVLAVDSHLEEVSVDGPQLDVPIRARRLGPSVNPALERVETLIDGLSEAPEAVALLRECWTPDASPDVALRRWIQRLFGRHGLLILDPSHPDLAEAAAPVHEQAITDAEAIAGVLQARSRDLEERGFDVQVHVRPGAPLSFVHPDGRDGPRHRVVPSASGWTTPSGEDLSDAQVRRGPHSTSALLRPILQDTWLPTAAYIGGPGEIAYFAQLPPLYEHFGIPMPAIVHRARFRVVDEGTARLLEQLDLSPDQLSVPRSELLARVAQSGGRPDPDQVLAQLTEGPSATIDTLIDGIDDLDEGIRNAAEKTRDSMVHAAETFVDRYRKALARDDDITVARLDRLLARLHPGGPQERVHSWPWYGARYGIDAFVDAVLDGVVPFDGTLQELQP